MKPVNDPMIRANLAFFKEYLKHSRLPTDWPRKDKSGIYRYNARDYVVLRSSDRVLAVYRIRPTNGILRRLINYPVLLAEEPREGERLYYKKT